MRILLLGNDGEAAQHVLRALTVAGYQDVTRVTRAEDALRLAGAAHYDAVILDRIDDGMDGCEVLERLHVLDEDTPVLALASCGCARHGHSRHGAIGDDFLAPPYDDGDLVAHLDALVRAARERPNRGLLVRGRLAIHMRARTVHWDGAFVDLTPKEFEILRFLAENADRIVSRQMIWAACWPEYRIPPQVNVIDVNLSRLRAKLDAVVERPIVRTVRKQGFVMTADQPEMAAAAC